MWRFYMLRSKETRTGWPIYLWPVIYVQYQSRTFDGRSVEKQSFGIGIEWLSYSLSWHGVKDEAEHGKD